jgi:hypothetical protein
MMITKPNAVGVENPTAGLSSTPAASNPTQRIIELSKHNVLTADYFINNKYTLEELETYKEICDLSLKYDQHLTDSVRLARKTFLENYEILLEAIR